MPCAILLPLAVPIAMTLAHSELILDVSDPSSSSSASEGDRTGILSRRTELDIRFCAHSNTEQSRKPHQVVPQLPSPEIETFSASRVHHYHVSAAMEIASKSRQLYSSRHGVVLGQCASGRPQIRSGMVISGRRCRRQSRLQTTRDCQWAGRIAVETSQQESEYVGSFASLRGWETENQSMLPLLLPRHELVQSLLA